MIGHYSIKNSYIRAITQFNNLPNELKTIRKKYSRKIKLKQWVRGSTKDKLTMSIRKKTISFIKWHYYGYKY